MSKVITGKVRASYVSIFTPKSINGSEPKYGISLIIPKDNQEQIDKINKAIKDAVELGISEKWGGKRPPNLKSPLRDGDTDRPDDAAYANSYFVNATSSNAPGVVDRHRQPITDPQAVYSGCYVRASITFYPYNAGGNRGIACGLNNVQFWEDGESLGGRVSAEKDFNDGNDDENDDELPF